MMKKTIVPSLVLGAIALSTITGCSEQLSQEEIIRNQITHDMNKDKEELRKLVDKMKEQDPKIKEAYYSINDEGKRVVNVVRESTDNSGAYLVAGMAAGMTAAMLMNNMNNNERDRKRSMGSGAYVHSAFNNSQTVGKGALSVKKRNAKMSYTRNVRKTSSAKVRSGRATVSSRSSAFSGSSSARSSGYSSGS